MSTSPNAELIARITEGARIDTPFESDCLVLTRPDANGEFQALDSDGVLCDYSVSMVTDVRA